MAYSNLIPAADWFFVTEPSEYNQRSITVWRLAAWGINTESEKVVGLVSVTGGGSNAFMPGTCGLVSVPPVLGVYKHLSELSVLEKEAYADGGVKPKDILEWPEIVECHGKVV